MKNALKLIGVITLAAIIGFSMIACSNGDDNKKPDTEKPGEKPEEKPPVTPGSGKYTGKDVLGNSYSISVGSDASRTAKKDDRFNLEVKGRDGKAKKTTGKVKEINADGTLTLETDDNVEFTATVGSTTLDSVAAGDDFTPIPFTDGTELIPRSFDKILLRASRWSTSNTDNPVAGPMHGEHWGSGLSVLVKDFPTNVSKLEKNTTDRYTITVSGKVDNDLDRVEIEIQGLTDNDEWKYLGGYDKGVKISANVPFSQTFNINTSDYATISYNLMDYKEIILQFTNVRKKIFDNHLDWDSNVDFGSIPEDIPDGQIMATISDFNITLKDKKKEALAGNVGNYTYGFKEDGLSIEYRQAVWSLSADNITNAKKTGAKFEFIMMDVDELSGTSLHFSWQDPVQELWWQEETNISEWDDVKKEWYLAEGVSWDSYRQKISIDISKVIKDTRFKNSTKLNFIVGSYWHDNKALLNIDDIEIAGANIVVPPPSSTGNMGAWSYGYQEDGISTHYKQAVWHLPEATLSTAKSADARLEIVFNDDLTKRDKVPMLVLVWQDIASNRWWPKGDTEEGKDGINYRIMEYGFGRSGVTFDSTAKKLTVILETALETYSGFKSSTDVNFVLDCWWGIDNTTELGIVSANIVTKTGTGEFNPYNDSPNLPNFSSPIKYSIVNDDSRSNVLKAVNPDPDGTGDSQGWAVALYDLTLFKNKKVEITFSAEVKRTVAGNLVWQINNSKDGADKYPSVGNQIDNASANTWHTMSGTLTVIPTDDNPKLYLSTHENNSKTTTYYVDNFKVTILEVD